MGSELEYKFGQLCYNTGIPDEQKLQLMMHVLKQIKDEASEDEASEYEARETLEDVIDCYGECVDAKSLGPMFDRLSPRDRGPCGGPRPLHRRMLYLAIILNDENAIMLFGGDEIDIDMFESLMILKHSGYDSSTAFKRLCELADVLAFDWCGL
jgi:hypothetical protein